jgi:hypothetical protein
MTRAVAFLASIVALGATLVSPTAANAEAADAQVNGLYL